MSEQITEARKIVWQSTLTPNHVDGLSEETVAELIKQLDDAVFAICEEFLVN
jgi:hypothetical protein